MHVEPDNFEVLPPPAIPGHIKRPRWINAPNPQFSRPLEDGIMIYSKDQLDLMKEPCKIVADCLSFLEKNVKVGMTAMEADKMVHEFVVDKGAYPSGVGFMGFGHSICISPNDGNNCVERLMLSALSRSAKHQTFSGRRLRKLRSHVLQKRIFRGLLYHGVVWRDRPADKKTRKDQGENFWDPFSAMLLRKPYTSQSKSVSQEIRYLTSQKQSSKFNRYGSW